MFGTLSIGGVLPASIFFNRLYPQPQRQVFPFRVSEQRPQFFQVAIPEQVKVERNCPGQIFYVIPVPLNVAFQLGQSEIIGVEGEEA